MNTSTLHNIEYALDEIHSLIYEHLGSEIFYFMKIVLDSEKSIEYKLSKINEIVDEYLKKDSMTNKLVIYYFSIFAAFEENNIIKVTEYYSNLFSIIEDICFESKFDELANKTNISTDIIN